MSELIIGLMSSPSVTILAFMLPLSWAARGFFRWKIRGAELQLQEKLAHFDAKLLSAGEHTGEKKR